MSTFWSVLFTPSQWQSYWTTAANDLINSGSLPVNDWNCSFQNPNWYTCLVTSWVTPTVLSLLMASDGLSFQSLSHWGFYATLGTPEVNGSDESGIYMVYPAWYIADAQVGAWGAYMEFLTVPLITLTLGGWSIWANRSDYNFYFWVGVIQVASMYFYMMFVSFIMAYNVITATYLQSRYTPDEPVAIQFRSLTNFWQEQEDESDTDLQLIKLLVYFDQLFFGHKRLGLYKDLMMGVVMALHPISLPFAMYFIVQLPFQFVLDLIVYPLFPQFDSPQIPWEEYLN